MEASSLKLDPDSGKKYIWSQKETVICQLKADVSAAYNAIAC